MCPFAPRVCSEPGGQKLVLSLSLDRIASWNFVRVPKAWVHAQSFSLKSHKKYNFCNTKFSENILESSRNISKTPPWTLSIQKPCHTDWILLRIPWSLHPYWLPFHAYCLYSEIVINNLHNLSIEYIKLEQLESLHSEDTPSHPRITHTIDSYWIQSQNKTKSKLQI